MAEIPVPQKPIPQFTIRGLMGITTGCAVVFSIVALAMRGYLWALGVSVAIGSLVLFMLVSAGLFAIVWIFSVVGSSGNINDAPEQSPHKNNDSIAAPEATSGQEGAL